MSHVKRMPGRHSSAQYGEQGMLQLHHPTELPQEGSNSKVHHGTEEAATGTESTTKLPNGCVMLQGYTISVIGSYPTLISCRSLGAIIVSLPFCDDYTLHFILLSTTINETTQFQKARIWGGPHLVPLRSICNRLLFPKVTGWGTVVQSPAVTGRRWRNHKPKMYRRDLPVCN